MSLLKDWKDEHQGVVFHRKVMYLFSPKVWLRLHRYRKQRANRGWSDQDTWSAGEYIAQITAEMLQHLNDHAYTDWPEWFKLNVQEEGKGAYKDLQTVIDDINNYLEFSKTSWTDDLEPVSKEIQTDKDGHYIPAEWREVKTGKVLTQVAVNHRMHRHAKEEMRLYRKAKKAMGFFGRHFASFWD